MVDTELRRDLHALIDRIVDAIEGAAVTEYVDQKTSPLGRARHCRLVREGVLSGIKEGRRVMVKRADLDTYLAKRAVIKVDPEADEAAEILRVKALLEKKSRASEKRT